jgi:ABC-type multidrug transport system fused ATPase/permease subunit
MNLNSFTTLLVTYLKPQRRRVALLAALLLGGIGVQLINPQIIRGFIDTAQARGSQPALLAAAMLFIAFAIVQRLLTLGADYLAAHIGWAATNALSRDLALHCLRLDLTFHKAHTPGELIERIDGDVTLLARFFAEFGLRLLSNLLLVVGVLALLMREDWRVSVALAVYTCLTFVALGSFQKLANPVWPAARQARANLFGFLEERIAGAEEIRALGAESYVLYRLYHLLRAMLETTRKAFLVNNLITNTTAALAVLGYAGSLAFGAWLFMQGQMTIGGVYLLMYYVGMLALPLQAIREQVDDLPSYAACIARIKELFVMQPSVKDKGRASHGTRVSTPVPCPLSPVPSVIFDSVSFHYEDNENVLHEVSFQLSAGKVLGVLGRTGSGKTTLTRLLFRLYDPQCGAIRLGDEDIRALPLSELRARVGMVTQDVQLFQATIRDNLTFFNRRIGDAQLERALKELRLWEWAQALPQGLDSPLAAGGQGLSAGEAQLLAFTRVFLKNPSLVILDEASSRLDPITENLLEHAVDRLFENRTAILIAHRLKTVQRADDILILEQGRVVEYGPREQLARDPYSRFCQLLQTGLEEALA